MKYKIAGLTVKMEPCGRTLTQAKPYGFETDSEADIEINLGEEYESFLSSHSYISVDDAEYVYTASVFYEKLIKFQGFVLHSSAVVVDGKAYLFSADSGTGKSTHTNLWLNQFGHRAYILNDDKPAIRLINGTWFACGTPWSGKHDISVPECVPLAGVALLNRAQSNSIERAFGFKTLHGILQQTLRPTHGSVVLLEILNQFFKDVPIWNLYCNMDPEAVDVAYNAMSRQEKE